MPTLFTLDDTNRVTSVWVSDITPPGSQWLDAGDADPPPSVGAVYNPSTHVFTPVKPSQITGSAFINRFTLPEQIAISTAASRGNAQMMLMLIRLAAASIVDLTDPEVQAGVQGLVGGILTQDRATAILEYNWPTSPPSPPPP